MRHSQLKAFHYVALHGGFSRAADVLSLTQPAISEQVRRLEKDHDVLLFVRDRKQVALTLAGESLFRLTERYFEVESQIADHISETRAVMDGKLRIIVDSAYHITHILGAFRARHPHATITLRTSNTEGVIKAVRNYDAEIGVAGSLSMGKEMRILDLGSTPIVAFAAQGFLPKNHPGLTFPELAKLPLILREKGSKTRAKLDEQAARSGVKLKPAIVAEGRDAIREIVASGAGIGFVSRAEFGNDQRVCEIPLLGVEMQMSETLIYLAQRQDVRVIRTFMEFARGQLGG